MNPQERLNTQLPPGRTVASEEDVPVLWLSDGPATAELWSRLRAEHTTSGLWPLLLGGLEEHSAEGLRPWESGELFMEDVGSPDEHDAGDLLADWWREYTVSDEYDLLGPERRAAVTAPYGLEWPGPVQAPTVAGDPGTEADEYAAFLLAETPELRLGLVPAASGAGTVSAVGWSGQANYMSDVSELSAVLADWERRFGARVVSLGFDTLFLSVSAPPTSRDEALRVAAEHFALCPDNVWQFSGERPLETYAEQLVGRGNWIFWWD